MIEFKLPEVAEGVSTGTATKINVAVGDAIKADQTLLELETEKAVLEVPSPADGVIKEILINEGDEVEVGQLIFKIEAGSAPADAPKTEAPKAAAAPTPPPVQETSKPAATPAPTAIVTAPVTAKASEDIPAQTDIPAAPSVRRLARELGLELSQVTGSGPGGRISKDDVKALAKQIIQGKATAAPTQKPLPDFSKWGSVKRDKMSNIRKATAKHMSYCWSTIPHVTQFDKADITDLEVLRKKHSTEELKLTVTPFLLKVLAAALKEFPQFNTSIDMETKEVISKDYINIGVAVDTENGLIVPVVRDVDQKDTLTIAKELNDMAEKARNRKTSLEDMQGGCFTLTNLGGIGGTFFTPIVNAPEVAILGVSRASFEPIYKKDGSSEVRFMLPFSLSYDHRIIDGADGARFLRFICTSIQEVNSV